VLQLLRWPAEGARQRRERAAAAAGNPGDALKENARFGGRFSWARRSQKSRLTNSSSRRGVPISAP